MIFASSFITIIVQTLCTFQSEIETFIAYIMFIGNKKNEQVWAK